MAFVEDGTAGMPDGYRALDFLDGPTLTVPVDTCRGCLMNERETTLPELLSPIFDDGCVTVRQDAEWAVPGFMVVGVRPHTGALDQMSVDVAERLARITRRVRQGMRDALGLQTVQMYQEEKLRRAHYHLWMLPLWPEVVATHEINPRIYESNIARYLSLFSMATHGDQVRGCVREMREYLDSEASQRAISRHWATVGIVQCG